jgi:hypothetical protein
MTQRKWPVTGSKYPAVPAGGIGRLVAAAIIDQDFCQRFLSDPLAAARAGFMSESFSLTSDEERLLLSVKEPQSLSDFAQQLIQNYNNPN